MVSTLQPLWSVRCPVNNHDDVRLLSWYCTVDTSGGEAVCVLFCIHAIAFFPGYCVVLVVTMVNRQHET